MSNNRQNKQRLAEQTCPEGLAFSAFESFLAVGAAPVSDALDSLGRHDRVLTPGFCPVTDDMVVVGRVRTLGSAPREGPVSAGEEYGMLIGAIDGLNPGDVMITDRTDCCVWGELCSERAMRRGGNGAIIDGYHRDTKGILDTGFSVVSRGRHLADLLYQRRIVDNDRPVTCGGVSVAPGDIVVADLDGVVMIPAALVDAVADQAQTKADAEVDVRAALRAGASVRDVWDQYKVL